MLTTGSVMLNPRTIENINSENQNKEGIPIAVNATSDPGPLQQVARCTTCTRATLTCGSVDIRLVLRW